MRQTSLQDILVPEYLSLRNQMRFLKVDTIHTRSFFERSEIRQSSHLNTSFYLHSQLTDNTHLSLESVKYLYVHLPNYSWCRFER